MASVSESQLQILISAIDEASSVMDEIAANTESAMGKVQDSGNNMIGGINSSMGQAGASLNAVGTIAGTIAAPINAFTQAGISGASDYQEQLTSLTDLLSNQASGTASTATQTQFLADKIANLRAENEKLATTHEKTAADQAKVNAQIQVNNDQITSLTAQMNQQASASQMAGANVGQLAAQFNSTAQGAAQFGFTQQDALGALTTLQTQTHNVTDTMNDYQVILDLAAQKHETLQEAVQTMAGAFTGRGMAISQATGIIVKDGLSAQSAFQAVGDVVKGSATKSLQDYGTQQNILSATMNDLQTNSLMPMLALLGKITTAIDDVITKVQTWTEAHPQLTKAIMEFALVFGGILAAIASFAGIVAPILITLGVFGVSFAVAAASVGIMIGAIVALAVIVTLIITYHTQIWDCIKTVWGDIETFFTGVWNWIKSLFNTALKDVGGAWNSAWTDISNFVQGIWNTITNTVKSGINDLISMINGMINAIDSIHINIPAITIPGTKIGTPALNLGFSIPDIPMLAAGGVVYNPILAMIGEQGPEAVVPLSSLGGAAGGAGGQQIVININGGIFPADQSAIKQIGNLLAKTIQQQIKLRNYAT